MIRNIEDPEHPLTLEQLRVVALEMVTIEHPKREVKVRFTPTIPHCSSATIIGLMIRAKLERGLPENFKINITITKGTHVNEFEISKQLNDKERVSAALENMICYFPIYHQFYVEISNQNMNIVKQINRRIKDTDEVEPYTDSNKWMSSKQALVGAQAVKS